MKIGILVAMEEEIKYLLEEITNYSKIHLANQIFYDGEIYGQKVTVVQSGIGKVNAAVATTLLIETFNAELVINTGSAGAISRDLNIGDLVIADKLAYNDVDNRVFNYKYGQIPQMPENYLTDKKTNKKINILAHLHDWNVKTGLILSGDSFVSDNKQIENISQYFPLALATEMEGTAVAQTCSQFEIPYTVIRAISDTADEDASMDFDEFVLQAGKKSAELVLTFIKEY